MAEGPFLAWPTARWWLVATLAAGIVASTRLSSAGQTAALPSVAGAQQDGHLYVSDGYADTVYEFPLVGGRPRHTPDTTISGVRGPGGIGIGPNGEMYVANQRIGANTVYVYKRRAPSGSRPTRILRLDGYPMYVLVDQHSYVYVTVSASYVEIFAPFAHGRATPLQKIKIANGALQPALDSAGTLYVLGTGGPIYVYGSPISHPVLLEQISPTPEQVKLWVTMAIANDAIYVRYEPIGRSRWIQSDFAVMGMSTTVAATPYSILTDACYERRGYGASASISVAGGYLYQSCSSQNAVFVYDARRKGRQQPLATLSGTFRDPWGVQVGP